MFLKIDGKNTTFLYDLSLVMSSHQKENSIGSKSLTIEEDPSLPPYYVPSLICFICRHYIGDRTSCKNPDCKSSERVEPYLESGKAFKRLKDFCEMFNSVRSAEPIGSSRNPLVGCEADSSSNPPIGYEAGQSDSLTIHQVGSPLQIIGKCLVCSEICTGKPDGFTTEFCSTICYDLHRNRDSKPVSI